MLTEAYGADAMKKSSVFEWHTRFTEGREDVKDDERTGRPKTNRTDENVEKVRKLICSDRRLSERVMAEELNLDRETVRKVLTEHLGMRKVSAKMVPRILSDDQKQRRLDVCSDLCSSSSRALESIVDFGFQFNFPPFLTALSH
jgi:hypothetical protein